MLRTAVKDSDEPVRRSATSYLERMGRMAAVPGLRQLLQLLENSGRNNDRQFREDRDFAHDWLWRLVLSDSNGQSWKKHGSDASMIDVKWEMLQDTLPLIQLLGHNDQELRDRARRLLATKGSEANDAIETALQHFDLAANVRACAEEYLAMYGPVPVGRQAQEGDAVRREVSTKPPRAR